MKAEDKIIQAAYKVYYQDASATFDKIAEEAGVSRMTIHRKFPKREALVLAACRKLFQEGSQLLDLAYEAEKTSMDRLKFFVVQSVKKRLNYHFVYQFQEFHELMDHDDCTAFYSKMEQLYQNLKTEGHISSSVPEAWFFHMFDAVMMTAWHTYEHGCVAPNDIPKLAWQSFLGSVCASTSKSLLP